MTAETAPHYFTLTEEAVIGYRTEAKMNPPLRTDQDVAAIRIGLADGTIDAVATDHAPHSTLEKDVEFDQAANGIIGLETSLPLTLDLVRSGVISLTRLVEIMSVNPARILGVPGGSLSPGQPADLTIIDLHERWICNPDKFHSLSRNTPFSGREMIGRTVLTMMDGRITWNEKAR
ncbi:MAG: amidohydrolase family protein [Deltaproteobacteria bacterium]|nr:amidohydrolase family protein [Deltaproteobacteria bacterium]